ncbi:MAG: sodium:solute symporter, partial [Bacteroidota bacterium]
VELVFDDTCKIKVLDPATQEMVCQGTDKLFPILALNYLGPVAAICFILGVIAAAYSSADSALTALTTAFCVDILRFDRLEDEAQKLRIRQRVQLGYAGVLFFVILFFAWLNDDAVIWAIFKAAGYTYGPLLGLYAFGLFSEFKVRDRMIPWVCGVAPLLTYLIQWGSPQWFGYTFGFEVLILNGLLTVIGLWLVRE